MFLQFIAFRFEFCIQNFVRIEFSFLLGVFFFFAVAPAAVCETVCNRRLRTGVLGDLFVSDLGGYAISFLLLSLCGAFSFHWFYFAPDLCRFCVRTVRLGWVYGCDNEDVSFLDLFAFNNYFD